MHRGIELRISVPAGPLFIADSDMMHFTAKLAGEDIVCLPSCPILCTEHADIWHKIIQTTDGLIVEASR